MKATAEKVSLAGNAQARPKYGQIAGEAMKTRIIFGIGLAIAMSCFHVGRGVARPRAVSAVSMGMLNVCREI